MRRFVIGTLLVLLTPTAAWASNDPLFAQQWALAKVGAEQAWSTGKGSGITIAIVDSGVDLAHEDLAPKLVPGFDFVENDHDPRDENNHGTHVAGIAAAVTGNSRGVAGAAPDAKIMPVRVLDEEGEGGSDDVEAGIRWATDHGARVINLSLGELTPIRLVLGSSIEDGLNYAWARGVVPVLAAGNDLVFPSGYGGVNAIAIAATDRNDGRPIYSNGTG
ncbi:MAG: S8 family serine peptidase, partial [Acidimicrobiia bacterium]